ncbi:MAG: beta-ketoacyl-[acyl-carrier-protein] synthase family protein [Bacteroidetes bacterium]|nr:beta-ketoacyl-[acyl-carrier-protein] synthase family protein [Bacteroidota bacterium]
MSAPVFIVNTGIITAIGSHTEASKQSLLAGTSGIGKAQYLSSYWVESIPLAEVACPNFELADACRMPRHLPRTALLSCHAAQEAWAPFSKQPAPFPLAFFSANTVGGMDKTEAFYAGLRQNPLHGTPADFIYHECGAITRLVARRLGFDGWVSTASTACSSSANSIMQAGQAIRAGLVDVALAGGADALCQFTLNGFNTLGILDRQPCQPFDAGRRGLNLGEGAGYLLLMSERALRTYGATPLALLSGWGNANDAYHQTASSPEGTGNTLAMKAALDTASLQPEAISYINLHGTGTENNDLAEGRAMDLIFGPQAPPASSTKAFTGHTLGASGAVEAVFSVLSILGGFVPPNLRWKQQMPEHHVAPVTHLEHREIRHVLSNSFGFGGACSSLVFSAC